EPFQVWSLKTTAPINAYPVVNDTILYFGGMDKKFYAVHAETGEIIWSYTAPYYINSTALVYHEKVYFECGFKLYALNALTGEFEWSYVANNAEPVLNIYDTDYHHSSPIEHNGIIYLADAWANVNGLNPETGELVFKYNTGAGSPIRATPIVKDSVLYLGDWDSRVYAVNMADSSLLWKHTLVGIRQYYGAIVSEFAIHDTLLYFGSQHDVYSPLDLKTGSPVWTFDDGKATYLPSTPVMYGDSVIIGTTINSNKIYSVYNGHINWEFPMDGICFVKPVIVDTVLFMNTSNFGGTGHLFAIDARNGKLINQLHITSASPTSPVVSGDLIFIGDNAGYMKAFRYKQMLEKDTANISMDTTTVSIVLKKNDENYTEKIPVNNIATGCDVLHLSNEISGNPAAKGITCTASKTSHLTQGGSFNLTCNIKPSILEVGNYQVKYTVYSERHPEKKMNKILQITIEDAVSDIMENIKSNECLVYPVPANQTIHFKLNNQQPGPVILNLFSPDGKLIFEELIRCNGSEMIIEIPINEVPVEDIGFYRLLTQKQVYTGTVLVNK
ncbi:MAG: PQQ-like beta-propeller repeat protein, partial [Bacteroidales bacterium]|nr:PQQ-like beta-propeller repeat protein [Bacteroidales bacterium]